MDEKTAAFRKRKHRNKCFSLLLLEQCKKYIHIGCSIFQYLYMLDEKKQWTEINLTYIVQLYAKQILSAASAVELLNKYGYGIGTLRPEEILLQTDGTKLGSSKVYVRQKQKFGEANKSINQYPYYDDTFRFHPSDDLKALLVIVLRTQYCIKDEL